VTAPARGRGLVAGGVWGGVFGRKIGVHPRFREGGLFLKMLYCNDSIEAIHA
jgi:hypothetical protein